MHEKWTGETGDESLVTEYVLDLINQVKKCQELEIEKMALTRDDRKRWYERNAVECTFKTCNKVLVLALTKPNTLSVNWVGPRTIERQLSETNYIVKVPGHRKKGQMYHVNILKPYLQREQVVNLIIEENFEKQTVQRQ